MCSFIIKQASFKINKNIANNLDIYARKKLTDAYIKMFAGFTWMNWNKNKSLGQAWQSAMEQAQATVKNADQKNVAGEFLTRVADAHKAHWSKIIMTNKNSDNKTNMTDAEIAKNKEYGKDMIRKSMATINMIMSQHIKHTNILVFKMVKPFTCNFIMSNFNLINLRRVY